jgi:hypothetical protein
MNLCAPLARWPICPSSRKTSFELQSRINQRLNRYSPVGGKIVSEAKTTSYCNEDSHIPKPTTAI